MLKNAEVWFVSTTDRGSNEVRARGIVQAYMAAHLGLVPAYLAASDCFEHLSHLITLGSMTLVDSELKSAGKPWRYFSSLAVFSHTARSLSKRIYHEWCSQHGPRSAKQLVHKLFPRCDGGRWNATHDTEQRILACTKGLFEPVLAKVLGQAISGDACGLADSTVWCPEPANKMPPAKRPRVQASASAPASSDKPVPQGQHQPSDVDGLDSVNGLSLRESAAYSQKMGKYRRSTLACSRDALWWSLVQVMNCVKQPTVHLSSFLKSHHAKDEVTLCGNALTQLVHVKAQELFAECESTIESPALLAALTPDLPEEDRTLGYCCIDARLLSAFPGSVLFNFILAHEVLREVASIFHD